MKRRREWSVFRWLKRCRPLRARASQTMPDIFIAIRDGSYINTTGFPLRVWTSAASVRVSLCVHGACVRACVNARNAAASHACPSVLVDRVQQTSHVEPREIGEKRHSVDPELTRFHTIQILIAIWVIAFSFFYFYFQREREREIITWERKRERVAVKSLRLIIRLRKIWRSEIDITLKFLYDSERRLNKKIFFFIRIFSYILNYLQNITSMKAITGKYFVWVAIL